MKYPMHEKLKLIEDKAQVIGEFLEFIYNSTDYALCEREGRSPRWMQRCDSFTDILAEYFDIDLNELDREKEQMLKEVRG